MEKTVFKSDALALHNGWREFEHGLSEVPGIEVGTKAYRKGPCHVLVSHEPHGNKMRWHLSISVKDRYPGWEEIKDARYSLLPHELTIRPDSTTAERLHEHPP